jgi:hypothetical protein
MKVLNCPHCGFPPKMLTERVGIRKVYYIDCHIFACNMPYYALGQTKKEAIMTWNKAVKDEQERIKK